mgnify:CR=1 FL=1
MMRTSKAKNTELPLIEDIHMLGKILGDVVREQEGELVYGLVEKIRKLSVAFHRDTNQSAHLQLTRLLKNLSSESAMKVLRAFTYFSHLANLAEDRHHVRRRIAHERAGSFQDGSISLALVRLKNAGINSKKIAKTLESSLVSPVLTAHPTEVQRTSILEAERSIAELLAVRDLIKGASGAGDLHNDALLVKELNLNEQQIKARVLQLWHTRLLRFTKLTVADEIENALTYYETTFLKEIPKIYAQLEDALDQNQVASFLKMGQWIGGDRDGNPNVTAESLSTALRMQSETALRFYLTEVHELGGELSISRRYAGATRALEELAARSGAGVRGWWQEPLHHHEAGGVVGLIGDGDMGAQALGTEPLGQRAVQPVLQSVQQHAEANHSK